MMTRHPRLSSPSSVWMVGANLLSSRALRWNAASIASDNVGSRRLIRALFFFTLPIVSATQWKIGNILWVEGDGIETLDKDNTYDHPSHHTFHKSAIETRHVVFLMNFVHVDTCHGRRETHNTHGYLFHHQLYFHRSWPPVNSSVG